MSTYLIADAINGFAKTFKKSADERNQIEKNKLKLEKAKFEFYKAFEEEKFKLNKQQSNDVLRKDCNHNWITEVRKSDYIDENGNEYCVVYQHCSECGVTDVRMQQLKT